MSYTAVKKTAFLPETKVSAKEALSLLPSFTQRAADVVRPYLPLINTKQYQHFLYAMYHYTRESGKRLEYASAQCDDKVLRDYFAEMAKEERGHYLLALRDFEAFGLQMNVADVPEEVKAFNTYFYGLGKEDCNEFVGCMYVFEGVAVLVSKEVLDMIARLNLPKNKTRWLRVHLEADKDHGSLANDMCERYAGRNPKALLRAAEQGTQVWENLFAFALGSHPE